MKKFPLFAATTTALVSALSNSAQTVLVDFTTPNEFPGSFNVYQNASPGLGSPYLPSPIGGLGNGGAIAVLPPADNVTADSTAILKTQSFDFSSTGSTLRISEFVNVIPVDGGGGRLLQLGFVNEDTSGMNDNAGFAFMSLRLGTVGATGNIYTPQYQEKAASGSTITAGLAPNVTLTPGNWYQLSGAFSNLGGGQFEARGALADYGPAGQREPVIVFTFASQIFSNQDVTSDSAVWPAFRSFHEDGANALDNLLAQAIPEPGALILWAVGLAGLASYARQGRKLRRALSSPLRPQADTKPSQVCPARVSSL